MARSRLCKIPGCDKPPRTRGWCGKHYERWRVHGDPLFTIHAEHGAALRYYEETILTYAGDECLIWPYGRTSGGRYAQLFIDGKNILVHRLACEAANGAPPTPELEAAHDCGKGHLGCVNRNHLYWATPTQNQHDRRRHGTDQRGKRNGRTKLTETDVRAIRSLRGKETNKKLAQKLGVGISTIADIMTGKNWGWLD